MKSSIVLTEKDQCKSGLFTTVPVSVQQNAYVLQERFFSETAKWGH